MRKKRGSKRGSGVLLSVCLSAIASLSIPSVIKADAVRSNAIVPASTSLRGVIDVSHWNTVDWNALPASLGAVYIKATQGTDSVDEKLDQNMKGAQSRGLKYGVYHYLDFKENASAQADAFYNAVKGYSYTCMPALDIEYDGKNNSGNYTGAQIAACARAFIDRFSQRSGMSVMVYCNISMTQTLSWGNADDVHFLRNQRFWVAYYKYLNGRIPPYGYPETPYDQFGTATLNSGAAVYIWNRYDMWQYTNNLGISGAGGGVDGDWAAGSIFLDAPGAAGRVNLPS